MAEEARFVSFESDGLPCVMIREHVWCGYVGVGQDHPWYGLPYNSIIKPTKDMLEKRHINDFGPMDFFLQMISDRDPAEGIEIALALRVHGGVTWSDDHVPKKEPDGYWYFGFDCGHAGDYNPLLEEMYRWIEERSISTRGLWRDQQYVVSECQQLAAQLVKIKEAFACRVSSS